MSKLVWGTPYDFGVDRGVVYFSDGSIEAWTGLVDVKESPSSVLSKITYRDGIRVVNLSREDSYSATVDAYTYPPELLGRSLFGFSYRVMTDTGYRIHVVYNVRAEPSSQHYALAQVNTFGLVFTTLPVAIPGAAPTAHLVVDTDIAYSSTVAAIEDALYGTDTTDPYLPSPQELIDIVDANAILKVTDNGDGTFTMEGPDALIEMLTSDEFSVDWPSVTYLDVDTYTISSL